RTRIEVVDSVVKGFWHDRALVQEIPTKTKVYPFLTQREVTPMTPKTMSQWYIALGNDSVILNGVPPSCMAQINAYNTHPNIRNLNAVHGNNHPDQQHNYLS